MKKKQKKKTLQRLIIYAAGTEPQIGFSNYERERHSFLVQKAIRWLNQLAIKKN